MKKTSVTLKHRSLLELYSVLEELSDRSDFSIKFKYFLARNLKLIEPDRLSIINSISLPPVLAEYNQKREAICRELSKKLEDGSPMISPNGNFVIEDSKVEEFKRRLEELKKEYSEHYDDVSEALTNHLSKVTTFLDSELEVSLLSLTLDVAQDRDDLEKLSVKQLSTLSPILKLSGFDY